MEKRLNVVVENCPHPATKNGILFECFPADFSEISAHCITLIVTITPLLICQKV